MNKTPSPDSLVFLPVVLGVAGLIALSLWVSGAGNPTYLAAACPNTLDSVVKAWAMSVRPKLFTLYQNQRPETSISVDLFSTYGWQSYRTFLQQKGYLTAAGEPNMKGSIFMALVIDIGDLAIWRAPQDHPLRASYIVQYPAGLFIADGKSTQPKPYRVELAIGCSHPEGRPFPFTIEQASFKPQ